MTKVLHESFLGNGEELTSEAKTQCRCAVDSDSAQRIIAIR